MSAGAIVTQGPPGGPVLLLHGQPGGSADWNGVRAALAGRVPVIVPDRPGWDGVTPAQGLAGNGRAILSLLDSHDLDRALIVGHSFGGAVAAWLAANAPERTHGLVLAAPAANLASLYRFDRWLTTPVVGTAATAAMLGTAGWVLACAPARAQVAARLQVHESYLLQAGHNLRSPRAWRAFGVEQQALLHELPELERQLGAIRCPTTIVIGSEDRVVPLRSAELLSRQIPGAQLHVLGKVGHLLPLFQPERLAEIVLCGAAAAG